MSAVENFIMDQNPAQKELLMVIHDLILSHPKAFSSVKWKIPFYETEAGYFCYVNPLKDGKSIELCFTSGHQLTDPSGVLETTTRKMVKGVKIERLSDELLKDLDELIQEAILFNA